MIHMEVTLIHSAVEEAFIGVGLIGFLIIHDIGLNVVTVHEEARCISRCLGDYKGEKLWERDITSPFDVLLGPFCLEHIKVGLELIVPEGVILFPGFVLGIDNYGFDLGFYCVGLGLRLINIITFLCDCHRLYLNPSMKIICSVNFF